MACAARSSSDAFICSIFTSLLQFAQYVLHPAPGDDGRVPAKRQLRGPLHPYLASDGGLEPHAVLDEDLVDTIGQRGEPHDAAAQVGVDVDAGDGDELEALVVDPLELL